MCTRRPRRGTGSGPPCPIPAGCRLRRPQLTRGRRWRVSLLEIIAKLEAILGRRLARKHGPPRPGDVPHTLADVTKGKRLLGYAPLVAFDEGLRRTVEYFRTVAG